MSAGRAYRRQAKAWTWRQPDTELSADTRAWVALMRAAHDDPAVTESQFFELARLWSAYMPTRPETEQVEAGLQLHEYVTRQQLGRPNLHAVAFERRSEAT